MNLGILPPLGGSLTDMAKFGQDERFLQYYAKKYCEKFNQVFYFSYLAEQRLDTPGNFRIIQPIKSLHRYLYGLLLPLLKSNEYKKCDVFRAIHLSGSVPAIIGKIIYGKKFIVNYNYDYKKWAEIENKPYLVPLMKILELVVFKLADFVFVADETMEKYVSSMKSQNKIEIIRNGVDTNLFKPVQGKINHKIITILSVGRLEKQKNYELLIEAVSICKKPINLVIVGRGSLEDNLKQLANKLNVNLKIIEFVPHTELVKTYQAADIYIQTSLIEAPVKTLLEAMSCGLPCIGTDVTGIRSVIEDREDGFLTDSTSKSLAECIEKLISDHKSREKVSNNAREKIKRKYNLISMIDKEIDILMSL